MAHAQLICLQSLGRGSALSAASKVHINQRSRLTSGQRDVCFIQCHRSRQQLLLLLSAKVEASMGTSEKLGHSASQVPTNAGLQTAQKRNFLFSFPFWPADLPTQANLFFSQVQFDLRGEKTPVRSQRAQRDVGWSLLRLQKKRSLHGTGNLEDTACHLFWRHEAPSFPSWWYYSWEAERIISRTGNTMAS